MKYFVLTLVLGLCLFANSAEAGCASCAGAQGVQGVQGPLLGRAPLRKLVKAHPIVRVVKRLLGR